MSLKKILVGMSYISLLSLSACTRAGVFTPNELPDAFLNKEYSQEISIDFDPDPIRSETFKYSLTPSDSVLVLNPIEHDRYNHLILKGAPKTLQNITLNIKARTFGTNTTGKAIEKTYINKVKEVK